MQIPKKLKIGGHVLPILNHDDNSSEQLGHFDQYRMLINLNNSPRVTEDATAECLLHEIFEAIIHLHNMEMDHQMLTTISEQLFAVIRDNKLDFRKP